ncbi:MULTISPECIES: YfcL family protein [unclassified Pseudoalteromonas]|uniref:YfcL family protein n=1 Tax=unclassified Pseudoalteromonas TaxID=194690 RepID=UPI000CF671EE|nr:MULTISPECIES: YfcL family protein [unclassified Pseudoalteromonas]
MPYSNYVDAAQRFFDDLVEHADDDQLFAGGYLRGHFDLAVGYAQVENLALSPQELNEQIEQSLVKAYHNGELTDTDRDHVVVIWEQVKALAS